MRKPRKSDRPKCGATTRKPGKPPCENVAGQGTDHVGWGHCSLHGGSTPDGKRYALRLQSDAEASKASLALARKVEPIDALLHVVYAVSGRVNYFATKLAAMDEDDMLDTTPRGLELAAFARMHGLELDRLARVSKMALDAGVAERRQQMAERTAALIAAAAEDAFAELGEVATAAVRAKFARIFAARLSVLEVTADDDEPLLLPAVGR